MGGLGLVTGYPGWLTGGLLRALAGPSGTGVADDADGRGAQIYDALADRPWRALVAPGTAPAVDEPAVVDLVEGDVRDARAVLAAMDGVDLVLHAAGLIHPRRIRELDEVNREGCRNVAVAAVAAGVRRLVCVSSNAAAGFAAPGRPLSEDEPPRPRSAYGRSKLAGEQALWSAVRGSGTQAVVLRPTTFYGPRFPPRQLRAFRLAAAGRPPLIGDGRNRVSMIYIDDLVDAVARALTVPAADGATLFVADAHSYEWRQVFAAMGRPLGVDVRPRRLPAAAAALCALTDGVLSRFGRYSMMVHVAGEATQHMDCRIDRARQVLGFEPRVGLDEGMRRAVAWAREQGWL